MKKNDIIKTITKQGSRLNVVISPEEMNEALSTILVCPLIVTKRNIPTQTLIKTNPKSGLQNDCFLALDQINTIDKSCIATKIGEISECESERVAIILQEMFAL